MRMIWATYLATIADYAAVLDQLSAQWQLLGAPHGMMLVSKRDGASHVRLYLSVTDQRVLLAFPEFEPIERSDIPAAPTAEEGYADEFVKEFPEAN